MNRNFSRLIAGALILTLVIAGAGSTLKTGRELAHIRSKVLRLHILAESDSAEDQARKLAVRDALLESGIFRRAEDLQEAETIAETELGRIQRIAEETLREKGSQAPVTAYLTDMHFTERTYGDITMPAGDYRTLRVEIGAACGHNWWCVMYPPLCIPQSSQVTEDKSQEELHFTEEEQDILNKPEKYEVRLAVCDLISGLKEDKTSHIRRGDRPLIVQNAENHLFS
ncbi:MAG: stage II sporulation protein R [Ruminococcus sp.]|nr:stage II sporulation protein R [Ruminococcus sp.]